MHEGCFLMFQICWEQTRPAESHAAFSCMIQYYLFFWWLLVPVVNDPETTGTVSRVQLHEWLSPPVPSGTNCYLPVRHLESVTQSSLHIPSVDQGNNTKHFGVRAFSNATPRLWNSLPITLRERNLKETFKNNPKTYLSSERKICSDSAPVTFLFFLFFWKCNEHAVVVWTYLCSTSLHRHQQQQQQHSVSHLEEKGVKKKKKAAIDSLTWKGQIGPA